MTPGSRARAELPYGVRVALEENTVGYAIWLPPRDRKSWAMVPNDTLPNNNAKRQTGDLPVHCAYCGRAITLFLDLNPPPSAPDRLNQERLHPWLCVWCGAENSIGLDGKICAVVKGHPTGIILDGHKQEPDSSPKHVAVKPVMVTVPVFCQYCGKSMLLTISRGPLGDERDEVDPVTQPQRWACPWCRAHNNRVFFGWLLDVQKNERYRGS